MCYLITYKLLLDKKPHSQNLSGKIKERTGGLISRLNNCMTIDRFRCMNYSQSAHREFTQQVERLLTAVVCDKCIVNGFWFSALLYCTVFVITGLDKQKFSA